MPFWDRADAGRQLAEKLSDYANRDDVLVLALPRGGVPVAFEVAQALHAPLDVFLVRKLGVPGQEELAFGAVASGGKRVLNSTVIHSEHLTQAQIETISATELRELERRERAYRGNRPPPQVRGRTVILVDDGLATGATMWAALLALREQEPAQVVIAVPTASRDTCEEFRDHVDAIICAITPEPFYAVGLWYREFPQTTDDEVRELLSRAAQGQTTVKEQ
jgi:predicted phosphoribosyltransferase